MRGRPKKGCEVTIIPLGGNNCVVREGGRISARALKRELRRKEGGVREKKSRSASSNFKPKGGEKNVCSGEKGKRRIRQRPYLKWKKGDKAWSKRPRPGATERGTVLHGRGKPTGRVRAVTNLP